MTRRLFSTRSPIEHGRSLDGVALPKPSSKPGRTGERLKPSRLDVERGPWGREYRSGSIWPGLALVGVLVVAGLTLGAPESVKRLLLGPPSVVEKQRVLVISTRDADVVGVRQTVLPRGYPVSTAADAEAGIDTLQQSGEIAFIVVDGEMPGVKRLIAAARAARPDARLIILTGARDVGLVANRLIDAGIR